MKIPVIRHLPRLKHVYKCGENGTLTLAPRKKDYRFFRFSIMTTQDYAEKRNQSLAYNFSIFG